MFKIKSFIILLFLPLILFAQPYTDPNIPITVTKQQPEFTLQLRSNPTTGYSWSLYQYDQNAIELIKHEFIPATNKKLIGAPGQEVWVFRAKPIAFTATHETIIQMIYVRPWEHNANPSVTMFRVLLKAK